MKREIKTTLALDGEREYNKALSDATRVIRVLDSELKATSSAFDNNTDSVEALTAKSKILRKEVDQQEEIVNSLRKAVDEAADKYGEADKRTDGYRIRLNNAVTALNKMNAELNSNERQLHDVEIATREASEETEDFDRKIEDTSDTVSDAGGDMKGVFGSLAGMIGGSAGQIIGSLGDIGDKIKDVTSETDGSADIMGMSLGGVATAAIAVVAALAKIGAEAYKQAQEVRISSAQMKVALGLTEEETESLKDTAQNLYAKGYVESFDDAMKALTITKAYMRDLDNESLGQITGQAKVLSDTFGVDMESMIKTASTMMNTFGDDAQTTMDTITALMQKNPAESGEFLDTLNEYSIQFQQMGYSAEEFASILSTGVENGAFSVDKVADAFKELNVRAKDGSDSSKEALMTLGLGYGDFAAEVSVLQAQQEELNDKIRNAEKLELSDKEILEAKQDLQEINDRMEEIDGFTNNARVSVDDFMARIAGGGWQAKESIRQVIEALSQIKDPLKRNELGVALMGSQWEDIGEDIILALSDVGNQLEDTAGLAQRSTDEIVEAGTTNAEKTSRALDNIRQDAATDMADRWDNFQDGFNDFALHFGDRIREWSLGLFGLDQEEAENTAQEAGEAIGTDMGDGVRVGLESTQEEANQAAEDLINGMEAAARDAADSHSYSRKWMALGADMGGGLKAQLLEELRKLSTELQTTVDDLIPSASMQSRIDNRITHSGTIRVEGVDNQGQLVGVTNVVLNDMIFEESLSL